MYVMILLFYGGWVGVWEQQIIVDIEMFCSLGPTLCDESQSLALCVFHLSRSPKMQSLNHGF